MGIYKKFRTDLVAFYQFYPQFKCEKLVVFRAEGNHVSITLVTNFLTNVATSETSSHIKTKQWEEKHITESIKNWLKLSRIDITRNFRINDLIEFIIYACWNKRQIFRIDLLSRRGMLRIRSTKSNWSINKTVIQILITCN